MNKKSGVRCVKAFTRKSDFLCSSQLCVQKKLLQPHLHSPTRCPQLHTPVSALSESCKLHCFFATWSCVCVVKISCDEATVQLLPGDVCCFPAQNHWRQQRRRRPRCFVSPNAGGLAQNSEGIWKWPQVDSVKTLWSGNLKLVGGRAVRPELRGWRGKG